MLYNWQRFSACNDLPTEYFFDHENDPSRNVSEIAKAACRSCPVRASCLDHALKYERYGFWAMTTKGQRVRMRKRLGVELGGIEGAALFHDGEFLLPPV